MRKNTEKLKNEIYKLYKSCKEEASPSHRRTLLGQLWGQSLLWCKDLFKYEESFKFTDGLEVEDLGEGIYKVIKKLLERDFEFDEFFPFFKECLIKEKNDIVKREIGEKGIKTPRNKTIQIYKIGKHVEDEEKRKERKLFKDELADICEQHRMGIHEYELIKNLKSVQRMIYRSKDTGDDIDTLDTYKPQKKYDPNNPEENEGPYNPEKSFFVELNMKTVRECVKAILDKEKEKRRECCRALFTLCCIENDWVCRELLPVLDSDILASSILDKSERPTQKEIYLKYYPDNKEDSASVSSTRMIKEFLADLENAVKKHN